MLMPTYTLLLLLHINPYAFGVSQVSDAKAVFLLLYVFTTSALIPGAGIAAMKPLGFIKNLESPDREERIGPYIVAGVFYLWLYKNLSAGSQVPTLYLVSVLSATISLFLAFFVNIFTKISAHATGMGGLVGIVLLTNFRWADQALGIPAFGGLLQLSLPLVLVAAVLLAGLVGNSRLVLKAHVPTDLWQGYAAGFGAVWLAQMLIG